MDKTAIFRFSLRGGTMRDTSVLVSIVMAAYNAEAYIEATIRSVIAQTVSSWELLVIDDCSNDGTRELVGTLAQDDPRICLICNEVNKGTAASRNRALDIAEGKYVAFLDSDDLWYPEKLEKQIRLLEQTGADLCYTSYRVMYLDKEGVTKDYIVPPSVTLESMLKQNYIGCSTVMLTNPVAKKYRLTPEFYHEDYVLWLQMLRDGIQAVGIADILMDYSYYASSRSGNKIAAAKRRWNVYRKFLKFSVPRSLWYIAHYATAGVKKYS